MSTTTPETPAQQPASGPINRGPESQSGYVVTAADPQLEAGLQAKPVAKPASDAPDMTITPASQPTQPQRPRIRRQVQPTRAQIEAYGIKIVDFAYTSTLPKVKGWRPKQYQPTPDGHKPLRREDTEPLIASSQESQPNNQLQPRGTEPIEESQQPSTSTAATLRPENAMHDLLNLAPQQPITGPSNLQQPITAPSSPTVPTSAARPWTFNPIANAFNPLQRSTARLQITSPLTIRTDVTGSIHMVDTTSPTTPTSPQPFNTSARLRRVPSTTMRPKRTRRKAAETIPTAAKRYNLRSGATPVPKPSIPHQDSERKRSLRSHQPGPSKAITLEARCPTPKRRRADTASATPYYPDGRPQKRRRHK